MRTRLFVTLIGAGLALAPVLAAQTSQPPKKQPAATAPKAQKSAARAESRPAMSEDMREAIAFEHNKDLADERQARMEAKHPSVSYTDANRSADRSADEASHGRPVKDPGPPPKKNQ